MRARTWTLGGPIALAVTVALAITACAGGAPADTTAGASAETGVVIQVHRSPTCDCCGEYEAYLRERGFEVESVVRDDVANLKAALGIASDMASCHTALVDGYFVEGHVPADVIEQLLVERPPVDGISLPGMPAGSPGMGGAASGPFVIHAITDGVAEVYAER